MKYLGKSFSSPPNSRAFVENWDRVFGESPIRTDDDHNEAVARIEAIFEAKPGTPEFDELDVLATLVDAYEREQQG
jgi:hypothetical protein